MGIRLSQPACEACGESPEHWQGHRSRVVLLAMEPGEDGMEWFLCSRCWVPAHVAKKIEPGAARRAKQKKTK